jgi:hypothetical protein
MRYLIAVVLLTDMTVGAQQSGNIELMAPPPSVYGTTITAPFFIMGADGTTWLTCDTPKMDGIYMVGASGCKILEGHTLDEVVSVMLQGMSDTQKARNKIEDDYRDQIDKDIQMLKAFQKELKVMSKVAPQTKGK